MKKLTLCKFVVDEESDWKHYPFSIYDTFVYMGEIKNMDGHCVVVNTRTNLTYTCYHTCNFVKLTEDEL